MRKAILTIQESGKKAAAIVQDLLTLARRGVPVTEVVRLNDIIDEYLRSPEHERLRSYHPEATLVTRLQEDLLNMVGSPVHLSKTIMNLVSNAAESLPGAGHITLSTENTYVDRPIKGYDHVKEGDYVRLAVTDNGMGIAAEDQEKIFEPFYTKKAMGRSGTGLGMAVVWGTVKDHNGYIHLESTVGKGTTFQLYFPVTRETAGKADTVVTGKGIQAYTGNWEKILVVDDIPQQREIAATLLGRLGYEVATVPSGEAAVTYLKTHPVDLLVLDMIMDPGMDGLETYKEIIKIKPGQKAVIASGFSETNRVKEAQRLGAGPYVKKPYTLEKIGPVVKAELERKAGEADAQARRPIHRIR